jgi:membrane associated rhomboid family serine protease
MLFFPYKLNVDLYRIPFLTILVCLACLILFSRQMSADSGYQRRVQTYCQQLADPNLRAILDQSSADGEHHGCADNLLLLRMAGDRESRIADMARQSGGLVFYADRNEDIGYKTAKLQRGFSDFDATIAPLLTRRLAYDPSNRNLLQMLTSVFAHASWSHVLGNLLFFFIFASFVESAIGYVYYVVTFLIMAVATSLAYSYSVAGGEGLPSVGLSGVVMGMLALITTLMPGAYVRCFFWFLIFVRRFNVPLLLLAAWYLGWDLFNHYTSDGSSRTNYVAHISGAVTGVLLGLLYRLFHAGRMRALQAEMPH